MPIDINDLAVQLGNIYHNGFERRGSYLISRETIRFIYNANRIESSTLERLVGLMRESGFVMYPLDNDDYSWAQTWVVDSIKRMEKRPTADNTVYLKALKRAQQVDKEEL